MLSEESRLRIIIAASCLLAALWLYTRVKRAIRRRRPPIIHPKLQKYQPTPELELRRQEEAAKILATATGPEIAGFRIVRHIDAVYADGLRKPDEAVEVLKATAAMKGASGIVNVRHSRSSNGKYDASGDAVVIEPVAGDSTFFVDG